MSEQKSDFQDVCMEGEGFPVFEVGQVLDEILRGSAWKRQDCQWICIRRGWSSRVSLQKKWILGY